MAFDTKTEAPEWACSKDLLCVLGTAGSLPQAPFNNEEYEIWGVSPVVTYEPCKRCDRLFEIHGEGYWKRKDILERLNRFDGPIYMQDRYKEVKNSKRLPIEKIQELPHGTYQTTGISYMLALAYLSYLEVGKPWHVALFGVHMEHREEYEEQRPCVEHWIGKLEGAGVDVTVAPGGALLKTFGMYGYENYNPVCYDIKERIKGLQLGIEHYENLRNENEGLRHQQIGAAKEAEHWLRVFQKGEAPIGD
jgi:hypothetical protein